jgi:hypothetical protein
VVVVVRFDKEVSSTMTAIVELSHGVSKNDDVWVCLFYPEYKHIA